MKLKDYIYKLKRKIYLKHITGNIGKVIENNNKIICYVNKKNILKKDIYYLQDYPNRNKENKNICYILENQNFNNELSIITKGNSEIIINNCILDGGIDARIKNKCIINNCKLNIFNSGKPTIYANNLIIKNMNDSSFNLIYGNKLSIYANNSLTIDNTKMYQDNKNYLQIDLVSNNILNIINSNIKGKIISLNSNIININNNSLLKSSNITKIYSNNYNNIVISSPIIILNGETINTNNNIIILRKIKNNLEKNRLELIKYLKSLKIKIEENNQNELYEYQNKLSNRPLFKSLKKKD